MTIPLAVANQILELHQKNAQRKILLPRRVQSQLYHTHRLEQIKALLKDQEHSNFRPSSNSPSTDNTPKHPSSTQFASVQVPSSRKLPSTPLAPSKIKPLYHIGLLLQSYENPVCNSITPFPLSRLRVHLKKPCQYHKPIWFQGLSQRLSHLTESLLFLQTPLYFLQVKPMENNS